jgi:hypothetical protein
MVAKTTLLQVDQSNGSKLLEHGNEYLEVQNYFSSVWSESNLLKKNTYLIQISLQKWMQLSSRRAAQISEFTFSSRSTVPTIPTAEKRTKL